ncbi:MAG: long-chain fatty acid transporter permease [Hymenobacter sp.]|nr:MAG: long-chain fatty acid transporter permease [Hymenobacter sp.]
MQAKYLLLAGGALLASTSSALASGFQVGLSGQKNVGMGGTGTGLYLDQAAQFYNPGAFAFVQGNSIQGGLNLAVPRISFRGEGGGPQQTLQNKNVFPFNGYAGFGVTDKFRVGIGVYTPFGSELHYAQGWTGRYTLTDINLRSVFGQLTASYAISPKFGIGAGLVVLAYGDVDLQRDLPLQSQNGSVAHAQLTGKADHKVGYNVGIMYKPSDKLSIGASYRSRVDARISGGSVALSNIPASTAANFTATGFSATLPLPDVYSLGVGIRPNDKLTIAVDANLVGWSRYQSLDFTYTGGVLGGNASSSSIRHYQDAVALRLGGQYKLTTGLTVRAGGFYDFACVRDGYVTPETPDANRVGLTAGFTYEFGQRFGIDGSFLFEDFQQRSQSQTQLMEQNTTDRVAGTYKTTISVPGVGVYFKF